MTDTIDTEITNALGTEAPSRRAVLTTLAAGAGSAALLGTASGAAAQETPMGVLTDKVALITGAARGIGLATAKVYAQAGAKVVMLDIADPNAVPPVDGFRLANAEEFEAAFQEVRAAAPDTIKVVGDVRVPADMGGAVSQAVDAFGGLDIAVANAGYVRWHPFAEGTEEDWKSVYDINVHGVFNTFKAATPALRTRGGGSLISVSSIAGRQGVPGNGAYNSSKWAVIGLTKQAALELGGDGIRSNVIAPGPVDTPMYRSDGQKMSMGIDVAAMTTAESSAAQDAMLNPLLPLGSAPASQPDAIAQTALYLASDMSADVSGAVLDTALGYNALYTG